MPYGSSGDYLSTGKSDFGIGLHATWQVNRVHLHGNVGATYIGGQDTFREQAEIEYSDAAFWFGLGSTWLLPNPRFALMLQFQGHSNALDSDQLFGVEPFDGPPVHVIGGARYNAPRGTSLDAGVGLGLTDSASEIIFNFGLNRTF